MENRTEIQKECIKLNRLINKNLFRNYFFPNKKDLFTKIFTSIDVIEDTQGAIDEFQNIPDNLIPKRTTLYIYGVLQAMYCQQDGVQHLYQSIFEENKSNKEKTNIYKLFVSKNTDNKIRIIRDDIAGHPADRNRGKEFYFIAKGSNTKHKFTYAGYTPEYKQIDVNIKELIEEQEHFVISVLSDIEKGITTRITNHKKQFMDTKLTDYIEELEGCKRLIIKGVFDRFFGIDTNIFEEEFVNLKTELNKRYFNNIPESVDSIFNKIYYILERINYWDKNKVSSEDIEVDIILESFEFQLTELNDILVEIDNEFKK